MALKSYWFSRLTPPSSHFAYRGDRFGVTAHALGDAVRLVRWANFGRKLDPSDYAIEEGITYANLEMLPGVSAHVDRNMGPMPVRGVWYPFLTAAPPSPTQLEAEFESIVPP
jgi:hypothetical protein